jgi:hypothetical protein
MSDDENGNMGVLTSTEWVTVEHVSHLTGKTKRTVRRWCKNDKVEARKEDGTWLLNLADLRDDHRTDLSPTNGESKVAEREDILTDKLVNLAEEKERLRTKLNHALPSGEKDPDFINDCLEVLKKICRTPFARHLVPDDIRERLLNP